MPYLSRFISRAVWVAAGLLLLAVTSSADTMAEKTLKDIVARQRNIFARAAKESEGLDEAWLRGELQSVINSYDVLIQKNPDFTPAYVTYGMLLGQVGMAKEAVVMLLKANKLEPNIPVVKNQIAKHLAEDGRPIEALPWIMAAIDLEPKEALYHYHLGVLLMEGRDDFISTGQFTRPKLDQAMLEAFQHAAEYAPDNFAYAYRHAEAYYDLETPQWDEALKAWSRLEEGAKPGIEQQTIRLHAANVLLKKGQRDRAQVLLDTVTESALLKQKQTLLDQMAAKPEK